MKNGVKMCRLHYSTRMFYTKADFLKKYCKCFLNVYNMYSYPNLILRITSLDHAIEIVAD